MAQVMAARDAPRPIRNLFPAPVPFVLFSHSSVEWRRNIIIRIKTKNRGRRSPSFEIRKFTYRYTNRNTSLRKIPFYRNATSMILCVSLAPSLPPRSATRIAGAGRATVAEIRFFDNDIITYAAVRPRV